MNFPVGSVLFKGDTPYPLVEKGLELETKRFSGYLIQTVSGEFIEEGVLFFREGKVVACIVECLAVSQTIKGDDAVNYFLNQTVGEGFYQCVELTRSQVDLVTAFDEKILTSKVNLKDLPNSIPTAFSRKFTRSEDKKSILDTYGLGDLK